MQIRGLGQPHRPRSASPARRSRRREIPLHPGSRTRRALLGESTIGVGRICRGDGRGAEHPPRSFLAFGRDARGRREVRKLRISGPKSPGNATCSRESFMPRENDVLRGNVSQRAQDQSLPLPPRYQRPPPPAASLLLRAPRGKLKSGNRLGFFNGATSRCRRWTGRGRVPASRLGAASRLGPGAPAPAPGLRVSLGAAPPLRPRSLRPLLPR